ncbi:helix-turn-helix domain-containing protein [Aequorivita echinoideorum]|uniref:Helix-turn-helix domain-containing protein n=1 Tax=Aequorivita echinoideorum TaxID=1549647 RepID=A0ABS5S1U3_9FLAO|nr:helix-turn-helix transcriptional regulator [Aequorivita echinoideorum]MBT0607174.1 helix-turn-helix domain-containing protein [Aequorivita echinoideorum]
MKSLGEKLKDYRKSKGLILRKAAALLDIDQSLISKFEKNERKPTEEQIQRMADFYKIPLNELMIDWLSEKLAENLAPYDVSSQVFQFAEEKMNFYKTQANGK